MLISRVSENVGEGGAGEAREESAHTHEYQTANELFELMAKNHNFNQVSEGDTLTARDLVILYKNIDIGTKLMSTANELKNRRPNQYVETVVHDEDAESDGSDISEIYRNEDIHDVVMVNKERIDILTNNCSLENTLCHKLGDLEIQSSDLTTEYDRHFIFKDPYIKEQLKNLKYNANENGESILPASLLDYICCKRLEDNYNFYMDNIIKYVKHTIDQLKRISNGDYLTDKAKEKWREVENKVEEHNDNDTKVLATSTSIPLHVERKVGGHVSTWDDLVHSEVDIRSLSKILEKKIIVEVPKLLCGSYTLFSKRCADNLIISCKREKESTNECQTKKGESRVDVVLQLQRSQSGQVMSNINSIMILKTASALQRGISASKLLPLPYKESVEIVEEKKVEIIEFIPERNEIVLESIEDTVTPSTTIEDIDPEIRNSDVTTENSDYPCSENDCSALSEEISNPELSASRLRLREAIDKRGQNVHSEAFNVLTPDELRIRMQRLNTQTALLEETEDTVNIVNKKKSPTRIRIKSPYENQSFIMEEKKRKKLLEIREKREKKKMALSETCKVSKHNKYSKGVIMPQPSSSVTKLSITNKSFYNSIYGQSMNIDNKQQRRAGIKKDALNDGADDEVESPILTPDKNSKKYINRSYYLDEAVTEMMYMEMKQKENKDLKECSASTSAVFNDFQANFTLLSQLIGASSSDLSPQQDLSPPFSSKSNKFLQIEAVNLNSEIANRELTSSPSVLNVVPMNTPKEPRLEDLEVNNESKNSTSSVECRKSIDKIYDLMHKLGKSDANAENKTSKVMLTTTSADKANNDPQGASTVQGSDSGTSLKHHLTSSNPSCFSFEKPIHAEASKRKNSASKKPVAPGAVVPKVIISSKVNTSAKTDTEKNKKERKKGITSPVKVSENPLKAISQLLHEFESVQKSRHKSTADPKTSKKYDAGSSETRSGTVRQTAYKRRSRLDQHLKEHPPMEKSPKLVKERKTKSGVGIEVPKVPHQQILAEDKHERFTKKKIADILDEAKEARGEAVRGPSKLNRLNSLAQPKRSYVQAHSEEYQTRYGRNLMADRLQRLAAAPNQIVERTSYSANAKNKQRRSHPDPASSRQAHPSMSPLERMPRSRRASSISPPKSAVTPAAIPSHKHLNIVDPLPPEALKKNIMVESYVKSHYGQEMPVTSPGNLLQSMTKARVPLFPNDLDLISTSSSPLVEESTEIGSKLHFIINTIINTKEPSLTVLTECQEINSKHSQETMNLDMNDDIHCPENSSSSSAAHVDIFEDKNVLTAVADDPSESYKLEDIANDSFPEQGTSHNEVLPFNSTTEMEKLENALYRKISVGTFQNRLRIKKLTLTPKQSMQQVFLLQSGDAGSMLLKSSISQIKIEKKTSEKLTDLKVYPSLSNTHMSWNLSKLPITTNIPMQITTVGYAFPQYESAQCNSDSITKSLLIEKSEDVCLTSNKIDKVSQCFKGEHADVRSDHGIQANIDDSANENDKSHISLARTNEVTVSTFNHGPKTSSEATKEKETPVTNTKDTSDNRFTQTNEAVADVEKQESTVVSNITDTVTYTSSLDVLVGLLNEIQKITTCQTHISQTDDQQCRELECILKDAAVLEQKADKDKTPDLVSMSSLDKLRQLESTPSIYSFYLSNDGDQDLINAKTNRVNNGNDVMSVKEPLCPKPIYADKEVNVGCVDREFMNSFTEAPSQLFPITVSHSTNVTNSLLGVLSEPSSQSTMYSFTDVHEPLCDDDPMAVSTKIKELPQEVTTAVASHGLIIPEVKLESYVEQICNDALPILSIENALNIRKNAWKNNLTKNKTSLIVKGSEFDPTIKIKRDVLVTMYSILVFTVFAALSFPEILY